MSPPGQVNLLQKLRAILIEISPKVHIYMEVKLAKLSCSNRRLNTNKNISFRQLAAAVNARCNLKKIVYSKYYAR